MLRNRRPYHLHLGTNTRDQLYMGNQLFIHHYLVQHNTRALFISLPYHDTTTLHGNLVIFYLRPLMSWYGKRGRGAPLFIGLYGSYGFTMCPSFPCIYSIIQISNFQSIPYFTMKHGNHVSCILSDLLEASHNYVFIF